MVRKDGHGNHGRCRSTTKSGGRGQLLYKMIQYLQILLGTDNWVSEGVSGVRWIMTATEEEVMEEDDIQMVEKRSVG